MEIKLFDGAVKTSDAQLEYVMNKVGAAASRLEQMPCIVEVRLSDINGPRGGADKECSIVVTPPGLPTVRVERQAGDYYAAIDAASAVFKTTIAKALEKTKMNGPR